MTPTDEHREMNELTAARRVLLDAGGEQLPRMPWSREDLPPEDATLLRFAMERANAAVGEASLEEIQAALKLLKSARSDLDALESGLMLIARAEGLTWSEIASQLGFKAPQAAQQRFQRISARASSEQS